MTDNIESHEGGCFCGEIRYKIKGAPEWSAHCHCRSCQKATGAAFTSWTAVKKENFEVIKGQISTRTWPGVERGFCNQCGTSLTYVAEEGWPGLVSILAPTFDDPTVATPEGHYYVENQLSWVKLDDGLPTHEKFD